MIPLKAMCLSLCLLLLAVPGIGAELQLMSVQVKTTQLRATPSFLGPVLQVLKYGARLPVVSQKGDWMEVTKSPASAAGWIHASALTPKRIYFDAGDQDVRQAATSDELALAGKGFNAQVEARFKAQNPDMDFSKIDQMEAIGISQREIQAFIRNGGLDPQGGF